MHLFEGGKGYWFNVEWHLSLTHNLPVSLSLSAGQMTDLIYTEKELVQSLREYIKAEESKLSAVKRYIYKLSL